MRKAKGMSINSASTPAIIMLQMMPATAAVALLLLLSLLAQAGLQLWQCRQLKRCASASRSSTRRWLVECGS